MNRIDRLFGILTLLQSKKYVTADRIAEKFNISVRTVYRDVKAICESGIPVSFEQYKGYFIVPGYFLPPVSFSSEEASALLLMETMVAGFADASIRRHYSAALNKIKSVLKATEKEKLEILNNNTKLQLPSRMQNDHEYLSVIQEGIASRWQLELDYQKKDSDSSTKRIIEPIGLIFYAFSWHVIAWCHTRLEYRDFRVDRIKEIKKTGQAFSKTDHIQLNDYMAMIPVAF